MSGWFLLLLYFLATPLFNANSEDPDQTPHFAASDLGFFSVCQCPFYGTLCINGLSDLIANVRMISGHNNICTVLRCEILLFFIFSPIYIV